jgi:hypothetical protein
MYVVQGASYNHNHANGMSVELYGQGSVMGPDPGNGLTYEDPMHVGYYTQWAAHNTVIAGDASSSIPQFKGGGGTKQIGEIQLKAMEPLAEQAAVSPNFSFTITGYTDKATGAKQERSLAIIRTSSSTGYYVDIYRSAHPENNTYVYHNIGKSLILSNVKNENISLSNSPIPMLEKPFDPPGLRHIQSVESTGKHEGQLTGIFNMEDAVTGSKGRFMKMMMAGQKDRSYFSGMAPATKTVLPQYNTMKTPTLVAHQNGEAWLRPFITVFEPYAADEEIVEAVTPVETEKNKAFSALWIRNKDNSAQLILQSSEKNPDHKKDNWHFKGAFGTVNIKDDQPTELYLGYGTELTYGDFSISSNQLEVSASMRITKEKILVSSNKEVLIRIKNKSVTVPASKDFEIRL